LLETLATQYSFLQNKNFQKNDILFDALNEIKNSQFKSIKTYISYDAIANLFINKGKLGSLLQNLSKVSNKVQVSKLINYFLLNRISTKTNKFVITLTD